MQRGPKLSSFFPAKEANNCTGWWENYNLKGSDSEKDINYCKTCEDGGEKNPQSSVNFHCIYFTGNNSFGFFLTEYFNKKVLTDDEGEWPVAGNLNCPRRSGLSLLVCSFTFWILEDPPSSPHTMHPG